MSIAELVDEDAALTMTSARVGEDFNSCQSEVWILWLAKGVLS